MLASRCEDEADETRRQLGPSSLLGHQKQAATLSDHHRMGVGLRLGLLQGQPQLALLHVRVRVPDPAQNPDDT